MDDADDFDWSQLGPAPVHFEVARRMLDEGSSFPDIRLKLTRQGLKAEFAEAVVTDLAQERVTPLVIAGSRLEVVQDRLIRLGLNPEEAEAVRQRTIRKHGCARRSRPLPSGGIYAAGGCMFVAGAIVYVGNATGVLPTPPGLGFCSMGIGAVAISGYEGLRRCLHN